MKRFTQNRNRTSRPGITAVLAMMYMTLFAALAIGFYASVTTSVKVAANEQTQVRAMRAAESGMAFMKYHLANLGIPSNTAPALLFDKVHEKLGQRLNGYANMGGYTVHKSADRITIPSPGVWMNIDSEGSQFYCYIDKDGEQLKVYVVGKYGTTATTARGLKLQYAIAKDAAKIFNFGVASKSAISMGGNVSIQGTAGNAAMGSVLSATTSTNVPLTMTGTAIISGDVSFVNPSAIASVSSNSTVAGFKPTQSGFSSHVHRGVSEVPFPTIDTTAFAAFVPSATDTGANVITESTDLAANSTYTNIRIKAGSNLTFNNNVTLKGVIYIEPSTDTSNPTSITFNGSVNLQGAIVVQTDAASNETYNTAANIIKFAGNVTTTAMDTLPADQFSAEQRALKGAMLLAPGFATTFSGNFGTVSGSIVSSSMTFNGSAGGTIKGSIINMKDSAVSLQGTSEIVIESQGTNNYPAGVYFGSHYAPLPSTYSEFTPQL
jgi:hypothetical protein